MKKMKRLLSLASLSLAFILCCCCPLLAQRKGQRRASRSPDKKLVLVARIDADFHDEAGGFTAHFPNVPHKHVTKGQGPNEPQEKVMYSLIEDDVEYLASFGDYVFAITTPADIKRGYDEMSQALQSRATFKFMNQRDVSLDGRQGREIVFELEGNVCWMRRFFVNQRDYLIGYFVRTKGQDAALVSKQWAQRANAFLDSFKITKLPLPLAANAPPPPAPFDVKSLPANFFGKVNDATYTNEFFGFSLSLPDGWLLLDREKVNEIMNAGTGDEDVQMLLSITKSPIGTPQNASLMAVTEKAPSNDFTPEQSARAGQLLVTRNMPYVTQHEIHPIKVDGVDFVTYNTEVKKGDILARQKFYVTVRNGFTLSFILTYTEEKDLAILDGFIQSVKFK
jgi:hypothetical protein